MYYCCFLCCLCLHADFVFLKASLYTYLSIINNIKVLILSLLLINIPILAERKTFLAKFSDLVSSRYLKPDLSSPAL